jgi:hypothetical protein
MSLTNPVPAQPTPWRNSLEYRAALRTVNAYERNVWHRRVWAAFVDSVLTLAIVLLWTNNVYIPAGLFAGALAVFVCEQVTGYTRYRKALAKIRDA